MIRFSILLFGLLCAQISFAQGVDWTQVHELTTRGLRHLYNLEVDEAKQAFATVSRIAPGDPRGPFFQSMTHFYLYGLNRDEKELSTFVESSEKVIDVCEQLLDRNGRDATTKFYLGGIYGYRGLAFHGSGSYLKAARDGRKGYLLLEEAVTENPVLYDAHMGFGLFRYLIAKVPKSMRWILSVLGFGGDLEGGLNSLRLAAEKGTYTRTEAKLFLAQFLFSEGRRDTAVRHLNELMTEYPENTLFLVLYASWQHRLDNLDEAMKAAHAAIELNNRKKIRHGEELAYSTLGSIYFTKNDFENAMANYRLYMRMTPNNERTPNYTFYRAGVACEIAGDRVTAVQFYKSMKETDNRPWDAQYYRRGKELLRRPLTDAEILLIKGENEQSQNKFDTALEYYSQALSKTGDDINIQARTLYGMQRVQFSAGTFPEAIATSHLVLALKPDKETWITPHAWFKLGQIYAKAGKTADARTSFNRVKDYGDYDFQDRLERQTETELKLLTK